MYLILRKELILSKYHCYLASVSNIAFPCVSMPHLLELLDVFFCLQPNGRERKIKLACLLKRERESVLVVHCHYEREGLYATTIK
jgi:hypothetical protein